MPNKDYGWIAFAPSAKECDVAAFKRVNESETDRVGLRWYGSICACAHGTSIKTMRAYRRDQPDAKIYVWNEAAWQYVALAT